MRRHFAIGIAFVTSIWIPLHLGATSSGPPSAAQIQCESRGATWFHDTKSKKDLCEPNAQLKCEEKGGRWYEWRGETRASWCYHLARDANKTCFDTFACEHGCLYSGPIPPTSRTVTGQCAKHGTPLGCRPLVSKGQFHRETCIRYRPNHPVHTGACERPSKAQVIGARYHSREVIERDYNGTGKWAVGAVQARYAEYASRLGVESPLHLLPEEYVSDDTRWIYPIMDAVIGGIKAGDTACCTIGVEFIEEDKKFTFGANLKARTARALKRTSLPQSLVTRIKRRVVDMLHAGNTPREYREYVKLLRKVGFTDLWPKIEANAPRNNKYAMRYFNYLRAILERSPSVLPREC